MEGTNHTLKSALLSDDSNVHPGHEERTKHKIPTTGDIMEEETSFKSTSKKKRRDKWKNKCRCVCVSMVATKSAFRSYWNLNRSCFINKVASYENRQYCDWGRAFTRPQSILMPKANDSQRYPLSMRLYVMLPQSAFGEWDEIFWMLGCNLPQQQHNRFGRRKVANSIFEG